MIALLRFILAFLAAPFKSKSRLEAENAALRHQLIVLRRKVRGQVRLTNSDRWFLVQLYRWFPSILQVLTIVQPETLVRWHRAGFRCYWRWKSRLRGGRPQIDTDLRALIRQMSIENPLWGAPRIHGELLKLEFDVAQSSVAKYMVKRRGPSSQGWRTFLRNHAPDIAAMDLFVVPTIGFDLLYAFLIVRPDRRDLVWINVTTNPTAEWIARQLTEAFPWNGAPRYLIRDRDRIYGTIVTRGMRAMGIRDKPTAGRIPDLWRASDAWLSGRSVDGLEIHGALSESAVADLEDFSAKSRIGRRIYTINLVVVRIHNAVSSVFAGLVHDDGTGNFASVCAGRCDGNYPSTRGDCGRYRRFCAELLWCGICANLRLCRRWQSDTMMEMTALTVALGLVSAAVPSLLARSKRYKLAT
jgi:hypothetical protein